MAVIYRCDICNNEGTSSHFLKEASVEFEEYGKEKSIAKSACNRCRGQIAAFIVDLERTSKIKNGSHNQTKND